MRIRRLAIATSLLIVACGAEAVTSLDAPDAVGAGVDAGHDASVTGDGQSTAEAVPDAGEQADGGETFDAGNDAGADATADAESDSGAYASTDAGEDSGQDSGAHAEDAGVDSGSAPDAGHDTGPDAGSDAGEPPPPPNCHEGAYRCDNYMRQKCVNDTWTRVFNDQSCCHDPRFSVVDGVVKDSATGLTWYRYGGSGSYGGAVTFCSVIIPNGRMPTTAELLAITIGAPVDNYSVCSPTVDQKAFLNVVPGKTHTSDGCVDLVRAQSATCGSTAGTMCVSP
jgi:hypothetical protein